jgi:hypothetical protein
MRQWELFGITDTDPGWTPPRREVPSQVVVELREDRPLFFWTTDAALRMRTVTGAAAAHLGLSLYRCEGRDLLEVFGMEGESLAILEAHTAALSGTTAWFTLHGPMGPVRCRVAPRHDANDRVIGTFCLATREKPDVDLREGNVVALGAA